jgi:hypothetical protein
MLNAAFSVTAGRLTAYLSAAGFAPAIGFLHADKRGRYSLAWDTIEPARPGIEARLFRMIERERFAASDLVRAADGSIQDETTRTGIYNPLEMVIKLLLNSIYGKLAQFVGERGKVPKTACPYYAAAITAYGRRRMVEAGLVDPYAIVFFATDGIVSTRPLHGFDGGLDRVKVGYLTWRLGIRSR